MSDITDETSEFILDPEGEVTIILHDPDAPFAVWDLTAASRHHGPCNSKVVDWTSAAARNATKNPGLVHAMALARRIAEPSEATAQVSSEANLFESETEDGREQEQPGEDAPGDNEKKALGEESTTPEPAPVRFRVSAKHLMLASPVFQHMLGKDGWKEGIQLKEHGSVDIDTYDFGTEALLVFLRIIHCQVTDLPETMSLELMARLAVVADYYECRDLVAYYVKRVILDNHCNTQPKRYTRTLVLWIWVAYFFRIPYLFDELTTTAVREAGGTITSLGLPIPRAIMDDLNRERVKGIKIIIDALHAAKESFLTPPFKCSMQCDSAMLGALMMQMDTHGVLSPKPQEPFVGLRHSKLMEDVGNFWCPEGLDVEHTIHYGLSKKPARRFNRHFKKVSSHLRGVQPPTFDNYLHPDWWFISGFILERYLPGCES